MEEFKLLIRVLINKIHLELNGGGILHFSRFFSFPGDYDRTISFNDLKFSIQAYITNRAVEFVDEINPLNRFEMAVSFNNSRSFKCCVIMTEVFYDVN